MAVPMYARLRMFWGALDLTVEMGTSPGYSATQIVSGGSSAAIASGIGVRRARITLDRTGMELSSDPAVMHFDFLNMTAGSPDDTWISSDYSTLETALTTWCNAVNVFWPGTWKVTQFSWYRVGSGVTPPNPAERITILGTPILGTLVTPAAAPQVACSITFRTGVRRSWGRTYLPWAKTLNPNGRPLNADVDTIASATNALVSSAASSDFHLVVVSKPLSSSLNVEHVEVDNVIDIVRRRRWKNTTYRKILP